MTDWMSSLQQTFEFYIVDPSTWGNVRLIDTMKSCTINWDEEDSTLGSASFECSETIGEAYIRVYLVTIQNGIKERHPLGVFLVQTPSIGFDGKATTITLDAYTPLIELKEKLPPLGYSIRRGQNIMDLAYRLSRDNLRAPVVKTSDSTTLQMDFTADTDDTWLTYISDLMGNAKYQYALDEMGNVLFAPYQDVSALQPVWTYDDSNSSILYPDITIDRDLYGIPNVVEVLFSTGNASMEARAINNDPNSPISTVSRGREIIQRITNPDIAGYPTQPQLERYAEQALKNLSSLEYTLTYTHGYCPARVGDCVRLNYDRAGLTNIKAKVKTQSIRCEPGCPVTETAVFTTKLWG